MAPSATMMKQAAEAFSRILSENGIKHAFIGGFALKLLGSDRDTSDIDVEVDVDQKDMRQRLSSILVSGDPRFVVSQVKLYFVPDGDCNLRIPIETLARDSLGLPRRLLVLDIGGIPILKPGVLVLTKIKRCAQYIGSTRPASVAKFQGDISDILHLLRWLKERHDTIDFANYEASVPERLYQATRELRSHWESTGQEGKVQLMDSVLTENDKDKVVDRKGDIANT